MTSVATVHFCLCGNFSLDVCGTRVEIQGGRQRAILALLATAAGHKKAREFLTAMLWPRSPEAQAAGSLRTALTTIRRQLGPVAELLAADRTYVWLDHTDISVTLPVARETFFEDAPTKIGTEFDHWLQTERSRLADPIQPPVPERVRDRVLRPGVGILPIRVYGNDPRCSTLAATILEIVTEALRAYEVADIFDFRHILVDGNGADSTGIADPEMLIELTAVGAGDVAQIGFGVVSTAGRQVLWNRSLTTDLSRLTAFPADDAVEFANMAVDAVLSVLFRRRELCQGLHVGGPSSMIGVLHKLFSMSARAQHEVRTFLSQQPELMDSAVANAAYALSIANTLGEENALAADLEKAREHAIRSREIDPQNPLVLALAGHVHGFALREMELGDEMEALARKVAPNMAICWDFSAMNAVYRGDFEHALDYSRVALKLGQFSAYRPLFQSSLAIASTLSGDHECAVRMSQSILTQIPDFLAVMRHCSVSLARLGRHEEALQMIRHIRENDEQFESRGILEPNYPLPSSASREAISAAFRTLGVAA